MSLLHFTTELLETGSACVSRPSILAHPPIPSGLSREQEPNADVLEMLKEFERSWRREFAGDPPDFAPRSALWACEMLHAACQCLAYRDLPEQYLEHVLSSSCPMAEEASLHYSVDLTFRFLPDLYRWAYQASPNDPLVTRLQAWARDWPLSSVGMILPEEARPEDEKVARLCENFSLAECFKRSRSSETNTRSR